VVVPVVAVVVEAVVAVPVVVVVVEVVVLVPVVVVVVLSAAVAGLSSGFAVSCFTRRTERLFVDFPSIPLPVKLSTIRTTTYQKIRKAYFQ
jgi:hypothetical protein